MRIDPQDSLCVGPWLVEPRLNRISRNGKQVAVEPKAIQVLVRLAQSAGRPVLKDELLESAWPEQMVSDDAIARSISLLRQAFGDDAQRPSYIETIRKKGYRLIAPVSLPERSEHSVTNGTSGVPQFSGGGVTEKPRFIRGGVAQIPRWIWAVVVLLLTGTGYLLLQGSVAEVPSMWSMPLPATTYPGTEVSPSFSPDGSRITFSWDNPGAGAALDTLASVQSEEGNHDIYVKLIDEEVPLRLTSHPAEEGGATFSPSGSRIAFVRREEDQCSVIVIPALGGTERLIGHCNDTDYADLAWSPDGKTLAFNDRFRPTDPMHSIVLLSVDTGERLQLTQPDSATWGDYDPAFSHDGQWVAYARARSEGLQDLYLVDVETAEARRITHDARNLYGHTWTSKGTIVFSSNRGGTYDLWEIDAQGGESSLLLSDTRHLVNPSFSADESRLVYEQRSYETSLWRQHAEDPRPEALVPSTRWDLYPDFSADGQRLAISSNRSGSYEIWTGDADGNGLFQLTSFGGPLTSAPTWSPDGRQIAMEARPDGQADIYTVGAQGGQPVPITRHEADDLAPSWTADGKRIYFGSNRGGSWQIWAKSASGGEASLVIEDGFAGKEGAGGDWFYYTKWGVPGLWKRPLPAVNSGPPDQADSAVTGDRARVGNPGNEEVLIIPDLDFNDWGNWDVTREGVYYFRRGGESGVYFFDFATSQARLLLPLADPLPPVDASLAVTPDGGLVYGSIDSRASDLMWVTRAASTLQ